MQRKLSFTRRETKRALPVPLFSIKETDAISKFLKADDVPYYGKWVHKENDSHKIQDRFLVIGERRVLSFKKGLLDKLDLVRDASLYDLVEVVSTNELHVCLKFSAFNIEIVNTENAGIEIPLAVSQALQPITFGFPKRALPTFNLSAPIAFQETDKSTIGPAGQFYEVYLTHCDRFQTPVNNSIRQFLINAVKRNDYFFCFNDFPEILPQDIPCLFSSLFYNTYFKSIRIRRPVNGNSDIVSWLSYVLRTNTTIENLFVIDEMHDLAASVGKEAPVFPYAHHLNGVMKVKFENTPQEPFPSDCGALDRILSAIASNKENKLKTIVLKDIISYNLIGNTFSQFSHSLCNLVLHNLKLPSAGIAHLFNSVKTHPTAFKQLSFLSIVGSNFGVAGTKAFAEWAILKKHDLLRLCLPNCNLDVNSFSSALASFKHLVELDLSKNDLSVIIVEHPLISALSKLICKGQLVVLKLAYTEIPFSLCAHLLTLFSDSMISSDSVEKFLNSIKDIAPLSNAQLSGPEIKPPHFPFIDFSGLDCLSANLDGFVRLLSLCNSIGHLSIQRCGFASKGITAVANALKNNKSIKGIDLSCNIEREDINIVSCLTELTNALRGHQSLVNVSVAGCGCSVENEKSGASNICTCVSTRYHDYCSDDGSWGNSFNRCRCCHCFSRVSVKRQQTEIQSLDSNKKLKDKDKDRDKDRDKPISCEHFSLGPHLDILIPVLTHKKSQLNKIDLSGNLCGTRIASDVINAIRKAPLISEVIFDGNDVGMNGLHALYECIASNSNIIYLRVPKRDMYNISEKENVETIKQINNKIKTQLKENHDAILRESTFQNSKENDSLLPSSKSKKMKDKEKRLSIGKPKKTVKEKVKQSKTDLKSSGSNSTPKIKVKTQSLPRIHKTKKENSEREKEGDSEEQGKAPTPPPLPEHYSEE